MLDNMLFDAVRKYAEKTAVVYDNRRMSFEQLYSDVCGLADGLVSIGIVRSDCIALILPNCIEFVTGFYAVARLNCIALPINPLLKKDEIKYYLSDCDAKVIITTSQYAETCSEIISELGNTARLVLVDKEIPQTLYFYNLIKPVSLPDKATDDYTGDVLYQYSSGSTGRPKRVVRTQENLFYEAQNFTSTVNVTSDDNVLCLVPLFHAHGLGNCLLAATSTGASLVILEQFLRDGNPIEVPFVLRCPRVLELLQKEKITILPGVPYVFSALSEMPADVEMDLSALRLCFSAGNFLSKPIFDAFLQRFGIPVRQLYGCTEAGSVSINLDPDAQATWNAVGRPLGTTEITIIDEQMNVLPCEQIGEIVIKSPSLTRGYFNMPDINKDAFRDGCFLTGDLGKKDKKGTLYITGRKKIFIDTGGHKVDPLEVEDVLVTHPEVSEVVVVGVNSLYGGEIVKAVVVLKNACTEDEIVAYCKDRLADFKVPRIVEFIDEIPKSPLGKVLRKNLIHSHTSKQQHPQLDLNLRQLLISSDSEEQRHVLVQNCLKEQLSQLLRVDQMSIDPFKPLSEFGLNSALAVEFKARLEVILGVPLSAALVWYYPNISELAVYLSGVVYARYAPGATDASYGSEGSGRRYASDIGEIDQISEDEVTQLLMQEIDLFPDGSDVELAEIEQLSDEDVRRIFLQETSGEINNA